MNLPEYINEKLNVVGYNIKGTHDGLPHSAMICKLSEVMRGTEKFKTSFKTLYNKYEQTLEEWKKTNRITKLCWVSFDSTRGLYKRNWEVKIYDDPNKAIHWMNNNFSNNKIDVLNPLDWDNIRQYFR